ncbi:4-hydroxy-2-oxovalerate aldolase [soil metagenome]
MTTVEVPRIIIHDVTLRDGNHALRHQESRELVQEYCAIADGSSVDYVEVGHGNGIGASSALVGFSKETDEVLLTTARAALKNKKLAVHCIPGFATVDRDVKPAIDYGVDLFRIGTHVTEADTGANHLAYIREAGKEAVAVLMMSHMATVDRLVEECKLVEGYGANSVVIMDSAGHFTPRDVTERITAIREGVDIPVGFHAHNNLGVGIANALAAVNAGATTLDASSMALGAGAGNAQLECLVAVLSNEYPSNALDDLSPYFAMSSLIATRAADFLPRTTGSSVVSAIAGVFSGYAPQVQAIAEELNLEPALLWRELGARRVVAGQESIIREIARDLMELS